MKTFKYINVLFCLILLGCSEDTLDDTIGMGTITGTAVMQGNNEPVENIRISTNPITSTVFTDENGYFEIKNVPQGEYSVQARKEGLITQFEGATTLPNAEVNVIFEMKTEDENNRQPATPQLISPEDNSEGENLNVEFSWSASDPDGDELTYELELRNDMSSEVMTFQNIADTVFTVDGLKYSHKYFWQVKASDGINQPVLSPVYSFETLEIPKSRMVYVKKINGNNVIFSRDEDENEYQLTSSNFNSFRPRKNNSTEKIAFLRTVGGQTHLFTMNQDGSQQNQVTSDIPVNGFNLDQVDYSWANDGATLVYPNFGNLFRINITGGGNTLIYEAPQGRFITEVDVSEDNSVIALLTNNSQGYDASIYTINLQGAIIRKVIEGFPGALGGLDLSVDKKLLLYTRDISGYESPDYRRLNSRMFLYDFSTNENRDISRDKQDGTNDLDPRFSPDEAQVIFVNTSNDGISPANIYRARFGNDNSQNDYERVMVYENAVMPDWE